MKRILCVILVILSFLTSTAYAINEPRHAPNMYINWASNQSFDAVDVDWLCDQDATNTYWAVHNWSNGYAGFQNKDGKHVLLLSLWDLPDGTSPQIEYVSDGQNGNFGGEGTGKQVFTNYNWQVGKWYSMRVQIDKTDNKVIYSQWIKEENGDWLKTAAISYPNHEFRFNGVSMFQEDFTFNNKMRSCKMRNARGKVYGSDNWEFLSRCEITNSFFPTDEATWEKGVLENITYNCDWDTYDEYVWVQSGGQGFAENGKTIPASYTLSETNNTNMNESNTPIEEGSVGENNETEDEDKDTTADNKDNRNWFQKLIDGIVKWIQSLLGIEDNSDSDSNLIDFSKNMGIWYYTPYTDYKEDDINQIEIKKAKNNKAMITWADNSTEQITFISENEAEAPLFASIDSKGNAREVKTIYIFTTSNDGKEMFERALRYADNNEVVGESAYGYRSAKDFFFDDITISTSKLLSGYIGKTVSDVRKSFGNGFSFEGYQGTSIMPYYDKGITFFLEKFSNNPSDSDKIIAVTSNNETKVFEKLSGKMSYTEIVNALGSEITLSQPKKYFSQVDNREEYILQFDYKGYAVDFTWLHDPNTNKSTYVYVSRRYDVTWEASTNSVIIEGSSYSGNTNTWEDDAPEISWDESVIDFEDYIGVWDTFSSRYARYVDARIRIVDVDHRNETLDIDYKVDKDSQSMLTADDKLTIDDYPYQSITLDYYEKTLSNGKSALVTDVFELLDGDKVTIILDEDGNLGLGNSLGHSIIRNLE